MGNVGRAEIIGVHLVAKLLDGSVNEGRWVGATGATPHYVWRGAVIERRSFGDDSFRVLGRGEVGTYVMEFLPFRRQCSFLAMGGQPKHPRHIALLVIRR